MFSGILQTRSGFAAARRNKRRGAIVVLAAFFMVATMAMVAFALDIGYLAVARTELQRTADAAAMAATWKLADKTAPGILEERARLTAFDYASLNHVLGSSPRVDINSGNALGDDVVIGTIAAFSDPHAQFYVGDPQNYNAVQVRVRRDAATNGEVPFFFARVMRINSATCEATATAAIMKQIGGFRSPSSGENLPILPIALHLDAWSDLLNGNVKRDEWAYNPEDGTVERGADDISEVFLYPDKKDSPGNFGTVDIGPASNSTEHLSQQILEGVSADDLGHHGGELKFDRHGELTLTGDTGISNGIKDELFAIIGEPRVIPIYRALSGNGDNAAYTVVKFAGVRIMKVELTGGGKELYIQPANVVTKGTLPAESDGKSDYVYSPVYLVR